MSSFHGVVKKDELDELKKNLNSTPQSMRTSVQAFSFYIKKLKEYDGYDDSDDVSEYIKYYLNTEFNYQLNILVEVFKKIINLNLGKDLNRDIDRETEEEFFEKNKKDYWFIRKKTGSKNYVLTYFFCKPIVNTTECEYKYYKRVLRIDKKENDEEKKKENVKVKTDHKDFSLTEYRPILDMIYTSVKNKNNNNWTNWANSALTNIQEDIMKYVKFTQGLWMPFTDDHGDGVGASPATGDGASAAGVGGKIKSNSNRRKSNRRKSNRKITHKNRKRKNTRNNKRHMKNKK